MLHFELLFTISFHTNLCHPTSLLNFGSWASSWLQCKFQQNNQLRHKGDWKTIWGLWLVAALYRGNCWWTLRSACNYLSPIHVVPNSPPPSTQHDSAYLSPYKIDKFQASFALYRFFFGCFFFSALHMNGKNLKICLHMYLPSVRATEHEELQNMKSKYAQDWLNYHKVCSLIHSYCSMFPHYKVWVTHYKLT